MFHGLSRRQHQHCAHQTLGVLYSTGNYCKRLCVAGSISKYRLPGVMCQSCGLPGWIPQMTLAGVCVCAASIASELRRALPGL